MNRRLTPWIVLAPVLAQALASGLAGATGPLGLTEPVVLLGPGEFYDAFPLQTLTAEFLFFSDLNDILVTRRAPPLSQWDPPAVVVAGLGEGMRDPSALLASDGALYVAATSSGGQRLLLTKSTDGGITWAAPWEVPAGANIVRPTLLEAPAGRLGIVWRCYCAGQSPYTSTVDRIELQWSDDWGVTWGPWTQVSGPASGYNDAADNPAVLVDTRGTIWVTWRQTEFYDADSDIVIVSSSDGGATWAPITILDDGALRHELPTVGEDVQGTLWVVYSSEEENGLGEPRELRLTHSFDHGQTWSAPERLTTNPESDIWPRLVASPLGLADLTWTQQMSDGSGWRVVSLRVPMAVACPAAPAVVSAGCL